MVSMTVELRNLEGTEAAVGWAGAHTVVIDRPVGKAGGKGLGFNGGQMLALAIGGCFCNDLRYVAHGMGVALGRIAVSVTLELDGEPLLATSATMTVSCETLDGSDPQMLIERAKADSTVSNSLARGFPVTVATAANRP
ncbi:oxidoreductase [Mesorhizobium sp. Root554]|uniref:OsmC family protein n=1 Tax=unclassified Mesorhizobium TaxID=325217 RepID=UPI0006F900C4|nr:MULTISPECIES: OsmC family protein [unclassified Mesorhizobium]KQZ13015.1 oxidoreductase [Mesorhizobium sp. Root1471]KQZ35533.1 oxidoreductase [Mesorhizobium sp. Root554]